MLFVDARGRRLLPNLVNFWCSLFVIIFCFSCHYFVSVFCRVFPLKLLFIGIVTFVNLGKTISDFPNNWYQSQGSAEYALWLQRYLIFHIRKGSFGLLAFFCSLVSEYALWLQC